MTLSLAVRHRFSDFELDVSFEAPPGVTALFGRSGSGKTTLINAICGLVRPDAGRVIANGTVLFDSQRDIWLPPHRRRLGCIFQEGRLFPHLSVRQNLSYGRWFVPRGTRTDDFGRVVEMLDISSLLERRPATLSGGEKQRVAIGRALLSGPQMILADEPLASLDDTLKSEILPYFEKIRDGGGPSILYVSHSMPEVARLANTVVALERGKVVRFGTASEVLSDPAAVPLIGVREAGSILQGRVVRHHGDGLTEIAVSSDRLFLPDVAAAPGSVLRIRISAQDVILARTVPAGLSALNILEGVIREVKPGSGPGAIVQLRVGNENLLARITKRSVEQLKLKPDMKCFAIVKTVSIAPIGIGTPL